MSWLRLKLAVPGKFADELSDYCLEVGALSAVLDNAGADSLAEAVLEPDPGVTIVWERAVITAFWPAHADLQNISGSLNSYIHDRAIFAEVMVDFVAEDDIAPLPVQPVADLSFGDGRLWLLPRDTTDERIQALAGAPHIKLDPGLAFGSGLHPTTQLCLDHLARMDNLQGARLLDFGCGSGVLALGALALGAAAADGVDHDPQALVATLDNAAYNDLGGALQLFAPADLPKDAHYEVVVANILANPLIELADTLSSRVSAGGWLIMAGLLHDQAASVQAAYPGFEFSPPLSYRDSQIAQTLDGMLKASDGTGGAIAHPGEDWVCLAGQKTQA